MMFRTLLFIPGNNNKFLDKSKSIYPDILCFDLEDSVPLSEKSIARDLIMVLIIMITIIHLSFLLELIHLNLAYMTKI
jgi:hypothetical protein